MRNLTGFLATMSVAVLVIAATPPTIQPKILYEELADGPSVPAFSVSAGAQGPLVLYESPEKNSVVVRLRTSTGKSLLLTIPKHSLLSSSNKNLVWYSVRVDEATLNIHSLKTGRTQTVASPVKGIIELRAFDSAIYALSQVGQNLSMSRIGLDGQNVENLGNIESDHKVVRFGASSDFELVIVDPVLAQFRVDTLRPEYKQGVWRQVQSDLVDSIAGAPPTFSAKPGSKVFTAILLSHKFSSTEGTHLFVLAAGQRGIGQYAIAVSSDGKEQRRYLLGFPNLERKAFQIKFENITGDSEALGFWLGNKQKIVYEGVK